MNNTYNTFSVLPLIEDTNEGFQLVGKSTKSKKNKHVKKQTSCITTSKKTETINNIKHTKPKQTLQLQPISQSSQTQPSPSQTQFPPSLSQTHLPISSKQTIQNTAQQQVCQKNIKKMLCNNVLHYGSCNYNHKCMYAHSLDDQILDKSREIAYGILNSKNNLAEVDLVQEIELYKTFIQLTKICEKCSLNQCPGGYNCKNGAIKLAYVICYNDLVNGSCPKQNCKFVHLTERGLIPYHTRENIYKSYDESEKDIHMTQLRKITPTATIINDDFIKKVYDVIETDTFKIDTVDNVNISHSDSDSDIDMNIVDDSCECDISIFTPKF